MPSGEKALDKLDFPQRQVLTVSLDAQQGLPLQPQPVGGTNPAGRNWSRPVRRLRHYRFARTIPQLPSRRATRPATSNMASGPNTCAGASPEATAI